MKRMKTTLKPIKREYILHFIVRPTVGAEELHMYRAAMNEKIQGMGGKVNASVCQETARRLAYPIKKEGQGYVCESVFLFEPKKLKGLSDALKQEASIIRYVLEQKEKRPKVQVRRRRSEQTIMPQGATPATLEKREKISMEEIDKKLDEIIKNI